MLSNLKLFLRKEYRWYFFMVTVFFFAAPINLYIPMTILPESLFLVIIYIHRAKFTVPKSFKINNSLFLLVFISICLVFGATNTFIFKEYSGQTFLQESYRLLTLYIFIVLFTLSQFDFLKIMRICLFYCKVHLFFTLYEIFYLNTHIGGDFSDLFLVGKAMQGYDAASPYLNPIKVADLVFIRPWGLMMQPQKSGFVFVIGIFLKFIIDSIDIRQGVKNKNYLWYFLFGAILITTMAKTAILTAILISIILLLDIYPKSRLRKIDYFITLLISLILPLVFFLPLTNIFSGDAIGAITNDTIAFFNLPWYNILFGLGVPYEKELITFGFLNESYYARVLAQFGLINTSIIVVLSFSLFDLKNSKLNFALIVLIYGMISHYCIINVYFFMLCLAALISYFKIQHSKSLRF